MDIAACNARASRELHEMLILRFEPVAVRLTRSGDDIPPGAIRPMRDLGRHLALCQAFALTRRDGKTVYMEKDDHWCWNPLVGFGFTDLSKGTEAFDAICRRFEIPPQDAENNILFKFPRLPRDACTGIISAPLRDASFEPDVTLIYSNPAQLRSMLLAVKQITGRQLETQLDALDSCVFACIPVIETGEFRVTVPDIGEYERAMAGEDEIILSVPKGRMDDMLHVMRASHDRGSCYARHSIQMFYDFPRPDFYRDLFAAWGLDI